MNMELILQVLIDGLGRCHVRTSEGSPPIECFYVAQRLSVPLHYGV